MPQEESVANDLIKNHPYVDIVFGTHNMYELRVCLAILILVAIVMPFIFSSIDVKDGKLVSNNSFIKLVENKNTTDLRINDHIIVANIKNNFRYNKEYLKIFEYVFVN